MIPIASTQIAGVYERPSVGREFCDKGIVINGFELGLEWVFQRKIRIARSARNDRASCGIDCNGICSIPTVIAHEGIIDDLLAIRGYFEHNRTEDQRRRILKWIKRR